MTRAKILLIDNSDDYRAVLRKKLDNAGFDMVLAASLAEGREALGRPDIDLAILDMRLDDDDDATDITGLSLAEDERFLSVPKIMLTGFGPPPEALRELLSPREGRLPFAFGFIGKQEGPEPLLLLISEVLSVTMSKGHETADMRESSITGREVFLVHGHDQEAKHELARFLEKLDLVPVILSETTDIGATTIIELIEERSRVCFAIVVMTPDDPCISNKEAKRKTYRARQNVIFEMGYFMGKLGRRKVCVLRKDPVEILSDVQGILYIPMDPAGGWKLRLAGQLKAAGFEISLDKTL